MTMVSGFTWGGLERYGLDYDSIKMSCEPCVLKRRLCCSTAHTSLLGRLMSILGYDVKIPCRRLADVVLGQLDILFSANPVTSLTAGMWPSHALFDHRGTTWASSLLRSKSGLPALAPPSRLLLPRVAVQFSTPPRSCSSVPPIPFTALGVI